MPARILLALDTPDVETARAQARSAGDAIDGIKLGLEFFVANGPGGIAAVRLDGPPGGRPLFLDLKLHDIPNTVAGAVRSALTLKPLLLTVHAGGGPAMLRAAAEAAASAGQARPLIIAVTVMTSLDDSDLSAVGQVPPVRDQARRLAMLARQQGCDGIVCSAHEIETIRRDCGPEFKLVVPGLRPASGDVGDQKRVMTPGEAARLGADYLVIGRPITAASDPAAAARAIRREVTGA
jgi:orotidine-5'-phosphate decarboxylase